MMKCVLVLLLLVPGWAQDHKHATADAKPAELLDGLGDHTHPIATNSRQAQVFFNQGLALIYGFNHDEAARLFARASEFDPTSPMPHWGIALALGPNYNLPPIPEREALAWKAIESAIKLAANAPANEQAYVAALAKRYSTDPSADRKQLAVAYKEAMKDVMRSYPDDLDAATLYAESLMNLRPWQLWSLSGEPAPGTLEIVEILERILRRSPQHPGANHYYIHAVEASKTPERALPSAMRLGGLMPGAGHMVHMPSHIFLRLGDFESSAAVNITASEVDRKYIARAGKGMYSLMYYSHNLHFVSYVRMMQGQFEGALEYSRLLKGNVNGAIEEMPMIAPYATYEWLTFTRFGKWREMLAMPAPPEKNKYLNAMYRYARGAAFAGLGQIAEAAAERERMSALANSLTEADQLMINSASSVIAVGLADLDGRISRAKGQMVEEVTHLRQAVDLQDKLSYMEPPEWHYPEREALGGALLRQGKPSEAEAVFRHELELNPRNGRALFGLLDALNKQGDSVNAEWVQREFEQAWRSATVKLRVDNL